VRDCFCAVTRRSPPPEDPRRPPATLWQPFGLTAQECPNSSPLSLGGGEGAEGRRGGGSGAQSASKCRGILSLTLSPLLRRGERELAPVITVVPTRCKTACQLERALQPRGPSPGDVQLKLEDDGPAGAWIVGRVPDNLHVGLQLRRGRQLQHVAGFHDILVLVRHCAGTG